MSRILAFLAVIFVLGRQVTVAESRRPTLVVFIADDHGQLDSTPYGAKDVRTPNMQRLADAGLTFTHAFVASPSCAPSRAAMLTGLMPARNGAEANHTYKRDDIHSLPEELKKLGYEIAAFGKVAHGRDANRHGFDHIDALYDTARVSAYLAERDVSRPLCLFVGTHDPHVPWAENQGYDPAAVSLPAAHVDTPLTRTSRTQYYTDVTTADRELGEIYDLTRSRFDPQETLFIYTSDHGAQWPFSKWNLYDLGIRVPFLAVWPGVIVPGTRSSAMIQWIDLLPTLLDVAGGQAPAGLDGRSFAKVLRGEATTHREEIFTTQNNDGRQNVYPIRSVRTRDFKYILNLHPEWAHTTHIDQGAGKGDGWRYFHEWVELARTDPAAAATVKRYHERPPEELYDLRADPNELHNLAADPVQVPTLERLRAQLESWRLTQHDDRPVAVEPRPLADPDSWKPREPEDSAPAKDRPKVKSRKGVKK